MKITKVFARQILDSRGNPTVEVDVYLESGAFGRAAVPSGASTGIHEALELRDEDKSYYLGKSILKAVENVNTKVSDKISEHQFSTQKELDEFLIELDGTENKSNIGANGILGISLAFAHATAMEKGIGLYKYIAEIYEPKKMVLPTPMFNIMNGGKHANWATDIQEYMVMPVGIDDWHEGLRASVEIFHKLEKLLKSNGLSTNVGNEGGFAPALDSNKQALELIDQAISDAGYDFGKDIQLAFDAAASEFYDESTQKYDLKRDDKSLSASEFSEWLDENIISKYPVYSFEDVFAEDDWENWKEFTTRHGDKIQVVGDDLLVTNKSRVDRAIEEGSCNALLVKVNQIGTLTETFDAMKTAEKAGWNNVISHRSGETEDVTISHIAVGTGAGQIKTGAPSRGERTAKYNELIRISEELS
jgi:enolase